MEHMQQPPYVVVGVPYAITNSQSVICTAFNWKYKKKRFFFLQFNKRISYNPSNAIVDNS